MPDTRFSVRGLWDDLRTTVGRVRRVLPIIARRHKVRLLIAMGLMLVNSVLNTTIPVLFGTLVTRVAGVMKTTVPGSGSVFPVAWPFLAAIGGSYLLRELLLVGQKYLVQRSAMRIEHDMTVVAAAHLFKTDLEVLTGERVGALQGRISDSVDGLVVFITLIFTELIPGLMAIACALIYVFWVDYFIGLVMLGSLPVAMALALRQMGSHLETRRQLQEARRQLAATLVERLGGIEYIRAANTGQQEVDRVERLAAQQRRWKMHHQLAMAGYESLKALNEGFFHLVVVGLAIYFVSHHHHYPGSGRPIEAGDIVTFSLLFYRVVGPLKTLWLLLDHVQECNLRVDDLLQMLAQPADPAFRPETSYPLSMMKRVAALYGPVGLPPQASPTEPRLVKGAPLIVVSGLWVEYPAAGGRPRPALRDVSVTVRHGRTVGVAGLAGSGKSTWLKVLLRLVRPSAGQVTIGEVRLEAIDRATIGRLFGYVGQTPFLFAGTVMENIAYGSEGATPEQVRGAAELARIDREIRDMPGGYQGWVAERGQNLSGGQRQRIALARVFLKDPPILLLDEGTAALDNINEKAIQEALAGLRTDRTTIMVAHRLTTLRDADEILVFDQGCIVESGTYGALASGSGLFARLVRSAAEAPSAP